MRSRVFGALALFVTGNASTGNKDKEAFGRSTYERFVSLPRVRYGRRCCALFGCRRCRSWLRLGGFRLPSRRWRIGLQPAWRLGHRFAKRSFGWKYERADDDINGRHHWQYERADDDVNRSFDWQCERLDDDIKRSFGWQCERLDHRVGKRSHDWYCKWLDDDVKRSCDWQR
jgi:hypothetical protein